MSVLHWKLLSKCLEKKNGVAVFCNNILITEAKAHILQKYTEVMRTNEDADDYIKDRN